VSDGFDLAIRFGEPPGGSLVATRLLETRVLTVASPGYIATYGRPEHPDAVTKHRRILFFDPVARRPFGWEFRRPDEVVEIPAEGHLLVSDVGTMLQAAAAGIGIAQILDIGLGDLVSSGQLVDLFPDWPGERFPLYAIYPSRRHIAAKVRAFVELCREGLKHSHAKLRMTP
jgi:DNA-binding transcriptional LysR family regulator